MLRKYSHIKSESLTQIRYTIAEIQTFFLRDCFWRTLCNCTSKVYSLITDLLTVAHGTFSSDHNFTASVLFNLLGGHSSWTKNPTDEVELQYSHVTKR